MVEYWNVCFAVGRPGVHSPCRVIPKDKKMVSTASLLGAQHLQEVVENKLASLLVVSVGKALNETPHVFVEDRGPCSSEMATFK